MVKSLLLNWHLAHTEIAELKELYTMLTDLSRAAESQIRSTKGDPAGAGPNLKTK